MTKTETMSVFMTLNHHKSRGSEAFTYSVSWTTRGTGTDVYTSKKCATVEEAAKLALKWLTRANTQPSMMNGGLLFGLVRRYVDTTRQPERFGYSLPQ